MRKRRISHRVLDHTYPELSVARATLVKLTPTPKIAQQF